MKKCSWLLTLVYVGMHALAVSAAPLVRFEITATVDVVDDPFVLLDGNVLVDDLLTGVFQYDLALPDTGFTEDRASYFSEVVEENFFNGTNGASGLFETQYFMDVSVSNDFFGEDTISIFATGDTTPSLLESPSVAYVDLDLLLIDSDQTAIADNALPTDLTLSDYEIAQIVLSAESDDEFPVTLFTVVATVTSITNVTSSLATDFNDDSDVDGGDFLHWQRDGLGAGALGLWEGAYGTDVPESFSVAIPEPSTLFLGLLATVGLLGLRRDLTP